MADLHDQVLYEKHRVIACDRGEQLELVTADTAPLSREAALELSEVLRRWATQPVLVQRPLKAAP